jgi:hypothetical protein
MASRSASYRKRAVVATLALAHCSLLGCGPAIRTVPTGPFQLTAPFTLVDFPPPPAEVQTVATQAGPGCRWVDGHYSWKSRRWVFVRGGWAIVAPECYRTQPGMAWVPTDAGAVLYYAEPAWYRAQRDGQAPTLSSREQCTSFPQDLSACR